jgi:hypothetical protein
MTETNEINDLWGTLPAMEEIRTPYTVLLEQALLLEEKTDGLLIGRVERYLPPDDPSVPQPEGELELLIVAPELDDYSYVVLSITYPVATLYPVTVEYDNKDDKSIICHSEKELLPALKKILSSEKTRRVIANLLAQISEEVQAAEERWKLAEEKRKTRERMRTAEEVKKAEEMTA